MADPINIPNQEGSVGIPSQYSQDINPPLGALKLSDAPLPVSFQYTLSAALAATGPKEGTVVGFNAARELIPAVMGTTEAIGVLASDVPAHTAPETIAANVWRSGHFNHKRLIWDASYATDVDKIMAFEGAPTPTNIRIGTPKTYTP